MKAITRISSWSAMILRTLALTISAAALVATVAEAGPWLTEPLLVGGVVGTVEQVVQLACWFAARRS